MTAVSHPGRPAGATSRAHPVGAVRPEGWVYNRAPMLVYWEMTVACALACRHCRATAQPDRDPAELSAAEACDLLDRIASFGRPTPHVVFTGGDPLRRDDLEDLVRAATERGIGSSLAPAVTPDLTRDRLAGLQAAGIQTISLSLDGSDAARHDGLRGVPGTFEMTMAALRTAAHLDLPVQVNTLVTAETLSDLPAVYDLLTTHRLLRWALFFLVSVGRGSTLTEITPGDAERLFRWLHDRSATAPFQIKTTEAMHYRRVAIRQYEAEGRTPAQIATSPVGRGFGIRDGNGILFISHDGAVYPSGFLPVAVGNVRHDDLVDLYRHHPTFVALRDVRGYHGRCGECAYAQVCGGSRARAYARTGDILGSDPLCPYQPGPHDPEREWSLGGSR